LTKATIPIPKLIFYVLGDRPEALSPYLILEFIEGQKLDLKEVKALPEDSDKLNNLYTSLADIYIQLRRLDFPSIGRLGFGLDGIQVASKTISIDMNTQELEGLQPSEIQTSYYSPDDRLVSANKYIDMLLDISANAFAKGQASVVEEDMGGDYLYHLDLFREFAQEWKDPTLDQGPFVLVHGYFQAFNLIVDQNMSILSALDWEWSRIVPRQFFIPPIWLSVMATHYLAYEVFYQRYLKKFDLFVGHCPNPGSLKVWGTIACRRMVQSQTQRPLPCRQRA